jgi:flagellar hook-associated protein 1 FlgK
MSGISQLLETARRALLAQQYGMAVTGHNIANASTPGYSRQRAEFSTTSPISTSAGFLGTGVVVENVTRMRNRFIDQQIRSSNDSLGMAGAEYQILSQIEATFNEPSTSGLSGAMDRFFQAWQELSTQPEDVVARNEVMLQGKAMTENFHRLNTEMRTLRGSLGDEITSKLDQINTLAKDIARLNTDILAAGSGGQNPNDMRDLRDLKLEELSGLANITVSEDTLGSVNVAIGGTLIAGAGDSRTLRAVPGTTTSINGTDFDQLRIVTDKSNGNVILAGGEAGGLLKSYNSTIPESLGRLDRLAGAIVSGINEVHASGYGRQNPPRNGINFFMGTDAGSIAIDLTDRSSGAAPGTAPGIDNIATSSSPTAGGNNDIALLIAGLDKKKPVLTGWGATLLDGLSISQYYNQTVVRIGSGVNSAGTMIESQELVVSQLSQQRESVSGVSLDEEMTNMIKFQHAFDAAARIVNTADEMFTTILGML